MSTRMKAFLLIGLIMASLLSVACSTNNGDTAAEADRDVETQTVHVNVTYDSNLLLAKYDVDMLVDDKVLYTIAQGHGLVRDVELEVGEHTLKFQNKDDSSVSTTFDFTLEEESHYSCTLKAHMSELEVIDERFETAVDHEQRAADAKAAKEEAERQAQEEEAAAEEEAASIEGLVGKKAATAKKTAEKYGYRVVFYDSDEMDITDSYERANKEASIRKAKVTKVEADDFLEKKVIFTLDYEALDPINLSNKPVADVRKKLEEENVAYSIVDFNNDTDMTDDYKAGVYDSENLVVIDSHWMKSGEEMQLRVLTQAQADARADRKAMRENLEEKLEVYRCWKAVQRYGESAYGSDFKVHDWVGVLAEEAWDEDTWFLKAECDVYGQSGYTVEAKVTGTSDNPVVIEFNVY